MTSQSKFPLNGLPNRIFPWKTVLKVLTDRLGLNVQVTERKMECASLLWWEVYTETISGGESAESRKCKSYSPPAPRSSKRHTKEEEVVDISQSPFTSQQSHIA